MQTLDTHPLTSTAMTTLSADNALLANALRWQGLKVDDSSVDLIGTDGKTIGINSDKFASYSEEERVYILAFISLMIINQYLDRRGDRDPYAWNLACGMSVHLILEDAGITGRPSNTDDLIDPECRGLTADEIYDRLMDDRVKILGKSITSLLSLFVETTTLPTSQDT